MVFPSQTTVREIIKSTAAMHQWRKDFAGGVEMTHNLGRGIGLPQRTNKKYTGHTLLTDVAVNGNVTLSKTEQWLASALKKSP